MSRDENRNVLISHCGVELGMWFLNLLVISRIPVVSDAARSFSTSSSRSDILLLSEM